MADINVNLGALDNASDKVKQMQGYSSLFLQDLENTNKELYRFNNLTDQLNESLKSQIKNIKDTKTNTDDWYKKLVEIKKLNKELADGQSTYNKLLSKINNAAEEQKINQIINEGLKARRKLGEELTKSENAQTALNKAILEGITDRTILGDLESKAKIAAEKVVEQQEKSSKLARLINEDYKALGITLTDTQKKSAAAALSQALYNEQTKDAIKNRQRELDKIEENITWWQKLSSAAKYYIEKIDNSAVYKKIDGFLVGLGFSWSSILKNVMEYNKYLTDAANKLGISVDGARKLADSYQQTSYNTKQYNENANAALMTIKAQFEAQQQLNDALGTAGLFTNESRVNQVFLTKQLGLQGEEAAKIYQLGKLSGIDAKKTSEIVAQEVINSGKQNKNKLDYKKVLQDVAKVEGQLSAQYQNNPELIAKAVTQAKQLGLELGQTAKMADSLLNFPASIENELKAELLTGKALNLERARELALRGESAAAAKELMDNVGGLSEFQNLNVLQQRSLADAIGLGVDELSNALKTQKLLEGSAWETEAAFKEAVMSAKTQEEKDKLRQQILQSTNAEQLLAQSSQISNQEKFTAAVDKLKESLANIVDGPLGKIIDGFANIVSNAETLKGLMYAIGGIITGQMLKGIASFGIQMAAAIAPTSAVAAASITTMSALTLGIGIAAIIAGAVAGISMLNSATGENISVSGATGGGVNTDTMTRPNPNNASNNSNNSPVVVHIDNRFDVGNRGAAVISTKQAISTNPYDKNN